MPQFLEVRRRARPRVESTGFEGFRSRSVQVNAVWLELSLTAIDLLAWMRTPPLDGETATAEPNKLRYPLPATRYRPHHPRSPPALSADRCNTP